MKRKILFFSSLVLAAAVLPAHAQVVPSANGSRPSLSAGGVATYTQPYITGTNLTNGPLYKVGKSENHLYGIGGFVDYRMSRWLQLEAEARFERWNQYQDQSITENSYSIGVREPIHTFGRITPYGKALIGFGSGNFLQSGRAAVYTLGGGVDYRLKKRLALRADFEYQHWKVTNETGASTPLKPYTAALGFTYKIF